MKFYLFLLCLLPGFLSGQNFSRIKADYSIKQKNSSQSALTVGKVYCDLKAGKIVYLNSFPEKETNIISDTVIYSYTTTAKVNRSKSLIPLRFSIFHLALNGQLTSFGLENSFFKITNVEKEKDMVITTWTPDKKYASVFGKILISTKNKQLFGIVIFNKSNELVSKQFYKNYQVINGLNFPTEIVQINYDKDKKETYQVTTYKNIVVNDIKEDSIYNMPLPR